MYIIYGFFAHHPITVFYLVILRLQLKIYDMVDNDNERKEIHIRLQYRTSVELKLDDVLEVLPGQKLYAVCTIPSMYRASLRIASNIVSIQNNI